MELFLKGPRSVLPVVQYQTLVCHYVIFCMITAWKPELTLLRVASYWIWVMVSAWHQWV